MNEVYEFTEKELARFGFSCVLHFIERIPALLKSEDQGAKAMAASFVDAMDQLNEENDVENQPE